jgi:stage III sporulation protein AD
MSAAFSVLAAALLVAVLYAMLKQNAPIFALLLSLGAAVVILLHIGTALQELLLWAASLQAQSDAELYLCLLRAAGVLLLSDYICTLCHEAGADSVAWCADFAGRCLVLVAARPLLYEIYQTIGELMA